MTDRRISTPLRAGIAAAALLALGGTLAPGYAREGTATIEDSAPVEDAAPRFVSHPVVIDTADLEASEEESVETGTVDGDELWEQYGSGTASWYGPKFKGRKTASGEVFDPTELTAAHRTLPFGTRVRVTRGGKSVVVRINDRGPFAKSRVIDVSQAAASQLGLIGPGHGTVTLALLDQ